MYVDLILYQESSTCSNNEENDSLEHFFEYAQRAINNAQFVVDALPNAELFSVEHSIRVLAILKEILETLDDPWLEESDIELMYACIQGVEAPLLDFQAAPCPPSNTGTKKTPSLGPGRPSYSLDLDRAILLHNLGNSWKGVADALGVGRSTLYRHLEQANLSPSRPQYSTISDDELDEVVAAISLQHPFSGISIMRGHLSAIGIDVSASRVQSSLRRVDPIGVLTR